MVDSNPDDLRAPWGSIRRCAEGVGVLPGSAYADAVVYRAEADLFRRHWVSVACGQNVPEPGDTFPLRIHDQSLLVVRGEQGELRVFYNLCRHRGARLVDAPCRVAGARIRCPYHAWSYHLDGRLASAPHFYRGAQAGGPDAEEAAQRGLLPLRSAVWRDVVFVNLSGDAPPFEEVIRPLDERMAHWPAEELSPLSSDEVDLPADWKLAAENFVDAYHLAVVHPEIGGGFSGALESEDLVISPGILGISMPQGYGEGSGQEKSPLPRFSRLAEDQRLRVEAFCVFPNTLILVEPDNQQVIVLRPQAPGITHQTFANYLVSEASQAPELADARAELYRSAVEINEQDRKLLTGLQQARSMDVSEFLRPAAAWDDSNLRFQRLWAREFLAGG
jgi:choline monooxygenase